MVGMEDVVETKLGMSLEDLIKEQKKVQTKKPKAKKKPATPQAVNKAGKPKAGKVAQEAKKPANQKTQNAPAVKSLKQAALKATKGGGIQKKGQAGQGRVITASAARVKNGGVVVQKKGNSGVRTVVIPKARPVGKQQLTAKGGKNNRQQQGGGAQRGQPSHQQQHRQQQPPPPQYQQQHQQQQPSRQAYTNSPPPGYFAPHAPPAVLPGKVRNPYSDALYAKSHKPLHARFEELHRVRADQNVVEATVRGVQQFSTGPRNKHGVLLPA